MKILRKLVSLNIANLKLQRIGGGRYQPDLQAEWPLLGVNIWPGHLSNLCRRESGIFLNVKSVHQVIRTKETVFDKLQYVREVNENRGLDFKEEIRQLMASQIVVTSYNNRSYKIDDVDFEKSPESTFSLIKDGEEFQVSFADYLRLRYKADVKDVL